MFLHDRDSLLVRILVWLLGFAAGCSTKLNPRYCDTERPCPDGLACDLVKRECAPAPPDMSSPDDLSEPPDLSSPDLTPPPDLAPPDDLTPPPDLAPADDLTPPVFFNPDVQAILSANGGGGCARSGCHNASDGLYVPFLIPNPSTAAAVHANYASFSAESPTTVIQKLVKSDGVAHRGTMTSPDRKPCASSTAEPCATLSRWYAEASPPPESAP